jgi:GR25 family glycosyltransferase involved in LPS biosynthesis
MEIFSFSGVMTTGMKIDGIDHIYILCCGKFEDRYKYMVRAMNEFGFEKSYYTFLRDDPELNFSKNSYWEELSREIIHKYYDVDTESRKKELIVTEQIKYAPKDISLADIAVSISHLLIWRQVDKRKYDTVLVLEDDILFFKDSIDQLRSIVEGAPADYDLISLEDGAGMHATMFGHKIVPEKLLYKIPTGRMRCCGAYLITGRACKSICKWHLQKKWTLEIDHVLDLYGKLGLLNVYWAEPCIFTQGSQRNVYNSGVQSKHIKKMTIHDVKTDD